MKVAAVDLGSNTCRLIIAEIFQDGHYETLEAFSRIVRLGENLSYKKNLGDAPMERALLALKTCARKIKEHNIVEVRCVATEACRKAQNIDFFKKLVKSDTGLTLEVISPEEEADLCLKGCEQLLNPALPYAIIFDIGGGSSEVMFVEVKENASRLIEFISLPFGVVGLSETYGTYTDLVFEDIGHAIQETLKGFKNFDHIQRSIAEGKAQMIGCSGTATTLAALKLNLPIYDRTAIDGTIIAKEDILTIKNLLWQMSPAERVSHPCIGSSRSDLVVPGLSIFAGIYDAFPAPKLCVADRGVRDGLIAAFASKISCRKESA